MALKTAQGVFDIMRAGVSGARTGLRACRDEGIVVESMEELCARVRRLRDLSRRLFEAEQSAQGDRGSEHAGSRKAR